LPPYLRTPSHTIYTAYKQIDFQAVRCDSVRMENDDARKLSPAEQHERRRQVILGYKRGRSKPQMAADVGLSQTAVSKVMARYEAQGIQSLAPRRRGRRHGEERAMTGARLHRAKPLLTCPRRVAPTPRQQL